ncbi:unnamed protein product [Rhizophagus irregularis]|nr:unnamed protein product [Rhizophagus irregularis]
MGRRQLFPDAFKLQYHVRADQDVLHKHTYSHNWFACIFTDHNRSNSRPKALQAITTLGHIIRANFQ